MLESDSVKSNIEIASKLFNSLKSNVEVYLLSKLSLLELSGWIESAMEDLLLRCAKDKLSDSENKLFETKVHNNHGFSYNHLKKLVINFIGLLGFSRLESAFGEEMNDKLRNLLNAVYKQRIENAHTYVDGAHLRTINSPDMMLLQLDEINNLLRDFELELVRQAT